MIERGRFIAFEGGVAAGKTTQLFKFKENYPNWVITREPGGTFFGEKIRDAVQGFHTYYVDPYAELFAYMSSRANLVRELIKPKLEEGISVATDRYWYSTYAYQGSSGVPKRDIIMLSKIATGGLEPEAVLYYDLVPEVALQRRAGKHDLDRKDLMELPILIEITRNYRRLARKYPERWYTIDASRSIEEVYTSTLNILKEAGIV